MRIKVGMKVEALITGEATNMGAWRAGQVIWGNGHSYVLRWSDGGPDSARISRKFVRPSPDPDAELPEDMDAGDIVELFDCDLWKWAEVVRVVGDREVEVKFVGSTRVVTADRSALRPRLIYGEKGWTLIHKVPPSPSPSPHPPPLSTSTNSLTQHCPVSSLLQNDKIPIESAVPSRPIAGKNLKTKAIGSNFAAAHAVKLGKAKRSNHTVDADIIRDTKRFRGDGNTNNADCFLARRTDSDNNDDDVSSKSDTSSSSSGSNSNGSDHAVSATAEHCRENQETEIPLPPSFNEEENEERHDRRVHGLELDAYVSVMKAFHARGSLSWTKEELLCNLRLHLRVSSDEHLQVICRLNGRKKPAAGPRSGRC
ncbi:unnamed protein product [Alopecurus aequalis]